MTNPGRPVDDATIDTAWGLAVADTVVRRFPNVASRDADLANFTAADLLGQIVVTTDTGQIQQFAGPILGWQRPWGLPWGHIVWSGSRLRDRRHRLGDPDRSSRLPSSVPSGRRIRQAGRIVSRAIEGSPWGASIYADGFPSLTGPPAGRRGLGLRGGHRHYETTDSEAWILYAFGLGCSI